MFDLRYHVASLAAVFLALIIGIVVGVGISGRGFVSESERSILEAQIQNLRADVAAADARARDQQVAAAYVDQTYQAVMADRLRDTGVAVVFVGSVDGRLRGSVEKAVKDASGRVLRLRALKVPVDVKEVEALLPAQRAADGLRGRDHLDDLGRALGQELALGGDTPLWDDLSPQLVEEQSGAMQRPARGVVVIRTATPQRGDTARFLNGFYQGLNSGGVATVGVEATKTDPSAIGVFGRSGFSTVDNVDSPEGRLALAVLLAGGDSGHFGVKKPACGPCGRDGLVPRAEPIPARAPRG
jgi:hypothetical protein